jgi:predicted GNAT family acetyltransferase
MLIQHRQGKVKSMFYVEQEGKILAEMVYSTPNPGQMIIEHTEVDESLGGKGVGKQLVHAAVEYARTNNIKIIPLCTFAKSVLDKTKEWQDVLLKSI